MRKLYYINGVRVKPEIFAARLHDCCRPVASEDVRAAEAAAAFRVAELMKKMLGGWTYTCLRAFCSRADVFEIRFANTGEEKESTTAQLSP